MRKRAMKKPGRGKRLLVTVAAVLLLLVGSVYLIHRVELNREASLLTPMGELVKVEGHTMSVYTAGEGERTLVFLSGAGTCSPILDFKSLTDLLSEDYRVAVVEKFGYGFSEDPVRGRDLETVLEDTRAALEAAGLEGPYVLCPHSMSGIEALYWAQTYPEEVEAIIGLDMAVPGHYEEMRVSLPLLRLGQLGARLGIARLIPSLAESDAIRFGTLTGEEQDIYRALFYKGTATGAMLREAAAIRESARLAGEGEVPQIPMLFFLSNGVGTGFDTEAWRQIAGDYLAQVREWWRVELDCPHYVHDHQYRFISWEIKSFLNWFGA